MQSHGTMVKQIHNKMIEANEVFSTTTCTESTCTLVAHYKVARFGERVRIYLNSRM